MKYKELGEGSPVLSGGTGEKNRAVNTNSKEKEKGPNERRVENQNSIETCYDLCQNQKSVGETKCHRYINRWTHMCTRDKH